MGWAVTTTVAGILMFVVGLDMALGEGLCEGQEPGGCPDHPDGVIGVLILGGGFFVVIGVFLVFYLAWEKAAEQRERARRETDDPDE